MVIVVAIVVSRLAGPPHTLPDVALEWKVLFYFERGLVLALGTLALLVILAYAWDGILPTEFSTSGLKYPEARQAAETAKEASAQVPGSESETDRGTDKTPHAGSVMELRMRLEAQMTYLAKWLLRIPPDRVTYVTVGSLRHDGLLTEAEAETAAYVLTLRDEELAGLNPRKRETFLHDADHVVRNLRAAVFYGLVRELLRTNGLEPEKVKTRQPGRRPLLVESKGRRYVIAPAFTMRIGKSALLDRAGEKLDSLKTGTGDEIPVIVVPDLSKRVPDRSGNPRVIKLAELKDEFGLKKDPRSLGPLETQD